LSVQFFHIYLALKHQPSTDTMPSSFAVETLQNLAANHIPTDEAERKALYDAAQSLMYKVESAQDTAQRLYHGVGQQSIGYAQNYG
jgi:hypothetical protein